MNVFKAMAGALGLLMGVLLSSQPAQADWLRAESPNFIVYGELPEEELRQRVERLEQFDQAMRFLSGIKEPAVGRKPEVYLVRTAQIDDVMRGDADGILGFYKATTDAAAFVATTEEVAASNSVNGLRVQVRRVYLTADSVLQHEYAHHFMFQHFNAAHPAWYREGFAEYVSTVEIKPEGMLLGKAQYGRASDLRNWVSARRFLQVDAKSSPEDLYSSYVQGWITTHYFYSSVEMNRSLTKYLQAINQGEAPEAALKASVGMTFEEFDRAVRAYIDNVKLRQFPGWKPQALTVEVSPVSAGRAAVLFDDLGVRLQLGGQEARVKALRQARARFPQDQDVAIALARALVASNQTGEVEALLTGVADSADVLTIRADALLLQASQTEDAAAKDAKKLQASQTEDAAAKEAKKLQARKLYARANKLDPMHVASLAGYAETLPDADQVSENALNIRMLAHGLAPQVSDLTIRAAFYLMKAARHEEAAELLQPVAFNAHAGENARYAAALLDAAQARQPPISRADWRKQVAAAAKAAK